MTNRKLQMSHITFKAFGSFFELKSNVTFASAKESHTIFRVFAASEESFSDVIVSDIEEVTL